MVGSERCPTFSGLFYVARKPAGPNHHVASKLGGSPASVKSRPHELARLYATTSGRYLEGAVPLPDPDVARARSRFVARRNRPHRRPHPRSVGRALRGGGTHRLRQSRKRTPRPRAAAGARSRDLAPPRCPRAWPRAPRHARAHLARAARRLDPAANPLSLAVWAPAGREWVWISPAISSAR